VYHDGTKDHEALNRTLRVLDAFSSWLRDEGCYEERELL
jgi:hypothetical protein